MSIVDIERRTTREQRIFEDNKGSDRSLIFLEGNAVTEPFSIELTIGSSWSRRYSPAANGMFGIPDDGITIAPRDSLVIEVAESMTVPYNMYGLVIPTGSLFLDRGIIIAAAKIEPSFTGKLKLRLVNTTAERHQLRKGMKVASAIFHTTEQTRFQPSVRKGVDPSVPQPSSLERARRWLVNNPDKAINWLVQVAVSAMAVFLVNQFL